MKKIIVLVCAGVLAMSIFAGCASSPAPSATQEQASVAPATESTEPTQSASTEPSASASALPENSADGAGVVNPMVEYEDFQALAKDTGIDASLPHAVEDVKIYSIDKKMDHITFKLKDGSEYMYRKAKADFPDVNGKDDISGYFVEWKDVHDAKSPNGTAVTVKTGNSENDKEGIVIWNDGTYKYCIAMMNGVDGKFDEGMLLTLVDGVK